MVGPTTTVAVPRPGRDVAVRDEAGRLTGERLEPVVAR